MIHHDGSYLRLAAEWLSGLPFFVPVSGKLNPVMWTLVVEVQFYMVVPLVFFFFKRIPPRASLGAVFLTFLVIPAVFHLLTGWSAEFYPKINSHFPAALNAFCLGILIAGLDRGGYLTKGWANLGWLGVILWPVALILTAWIDSHPAWGNPVWREVFGYLIKIASGCLLLFVANPQHPVARLLCASWLRWCGIISYEWYLFHQPFVVWSRDFFPPAGGSIGRYAVIVGSPFLISTILAAVVYHCFSLPILKYGRLSK